jgi:hypothetical protein
MSNAPELKTIVHRRSTVTEGRWTLITLGLTAAGFFVLQWFLFPRIWRQDRLFVVEFCAVEAIVAALALYYAAINLRAGDIFECRLDERAISCHRPVRHTSESFSIALSDIVKVEKENWSESHRWHLWDRDGRRCWLTSNYGNPHDEIVAAILARYPALEQVSS